MTDEEAEALRILNALRPEQPDRCEDIGLLGRCSTTRSLEQCERCGSTMCCAHLFHRRSRGCFICNDMSYLPGVIGAAENDKEAD